MLCQITIQRLQLANMPLYRFAYGTDLERQLHWKQVLVSLLSRPSHVRVSVKSSLCQLDLPWKPKTLRVGIGIAPNCLWSIFCKFDSLGQPNLLPVAGGGCSSPYSIMYCMVFVSLLAPESSSEDIWHLVLSEIQVQAASPAPS